MVSLSTITPRRCVRRKPAQSALRALALLCTLGSAQAHAQFLDMLKNAVGNAAASAVTNAATQATSSVVNGAIDGAKNGVKSGAKNGVTAPAQPAAQLAAAPAPQPALDRAAAPAGANQAHYCPAMDGPALPPLGPRPADYQPEVLWPDAPKCTPHEFPDYRFEAARAQVKAFEKAGSVHCPECGGYGQALDFQARGLITKDGRFARDFDEPIVKLRPGEHMDWQGKFLHGTIVLVGEQPINGFPCRQYKWTLFNKNDEVVAERPGMYCKFQIRFRDDEAKWHQVV